MLTILTRLGEDSLDIVRDLGLCLESQTSSQFEWLLICRPQVSKELILKNQIISTHGSLYEKTKILQGETNNRSALLNFGLKESAGDLIVVVDDDDLILENYVEELLKAGRLNNYSSIIRANSLLMDCVLKCNNNQTYFQQVSKISRPWPKTFNQDTFLKKNSTPCMSIAYPTKIIKNLNLAWNEELQVVEDWDFALRVTRLVPVNSILAEIGIYRRNAGHYRSKAAIERKTWRKNELYVRRSAYRARNLRLSNSEIVRFYISHCLSGNKISKSILNFRLLLLQWIKSQLRIYSFIRILRLRVVRILRK
jgi:glycosyltransferase involved in cell wall biosynthesis